MTRRRLRDAARFTIATGVAAVAGGCVGPPYNWAMVNHSSRELDVETEVTCTQRGHVIVVLSGVLSPGKGSRMTDIAVRPLPDVVHVHLVSDGVSHDSDVLVHGHVSNEENFRDVLCLVVTDAGVTLRPETVDELFNGPSPGPTAAQP